jgi:bisanhydrobacterioruberin hydratase
LNYNIAPVRYMQPLNKIQVFLKRNTKSTKGFFLIFYAVGVAGLINSYTFQLFVQLIPFALLLSIVALAFFHRSFTQIQLILYIVIYLIGFLIEMAGVNTGLIFGPYTYGESLGLKLFNTPLIIGLNWLLLVYVTASVMENTGLHPAVKVIAGAGLMLAYDIVLEQVAPVLDMWYWQTGNVPVQNYLSWFILAILFHTLIRMYKINTKNKMGPFLFVCQAVFFLLLFIFLV